MTIPEMITAVKENEITDELVNALVEFMWDFDPYGIMDAYGHIDDDGVRGQLIEEVRYCLGSDKEVILENLNYANVTAGFKENY